MHTSQEIADRIKLLLKVRKITADKMLKDCDINKNALSTMYGGSLPRVETITKIADYLDCSVDYLLGRDSIVSPCLTENEKEIIGMYQQLPENVRQRIYAYILGTLDTEKDKS